MVELRSRRSLGKKENASPSGSPNSVAHALLKKARDATGAAVPLDVERRKSANAEGSHNGVDRPLQMLCIAFMVLPVVWACLTQESPTARDQVVGWATTSWNQLTDGKITLSFQIAAGLLLIERICYTWVHTFSTHFVKFTASPLGKAMGKKPLDVVLTIFYINKCIQFGVFFGFYFYVIGFVSPFTAGFTRAPLVGSGAESAESAALHMWESRTRLQWVMLMQGMVAGQGLNLAIYRAIGKAGVYYGYRLGEPVPWCSGFPFSVMSHPQYAGVCLCCACVNAFCALPAHVAAGWFNLTAIQVLLYVYMGLVEDYL